ncbi:hypothetical protein F4810DRAFT_710234 [Camillea tinctor]|nr:hypothetical protein F4810DRAFT_710234 [Camillea tinctor]
MEDTKEQSKNTWSQPQPYEKEKQSYHYETESDPFASERPRLFPRPSGSPDPYASDRPPIPPSLLPPAPRPEVKQPRPPSPSGFSPTRPTLQRPLSLPKPPTAFALACLESTNPALRRDIRRQPILRPTLQPTTPRNKSTSSPLASKAAITESRPERLVPKVTIAEIAQPATPKFPPRFVVPDSPCDTDDTGPSEPGTPQTVLRFVVPDEPDPPEVDTPKLDTRKPDLDSIPGTWPSWADDEPKPRPTGNMTFTAKMGANIWDTVSSLVDATSVIYTTFSQRFLGRRPQEHAPITLIAGPSPKQHKLDDNGSFDSDIGTRENPIEIDDSMDIEYHGESDNLATGYTSSSDENDDNRAEESEPQVPQQDISPRSSSAAAAAQRAVRFFPSKNRHASSSQVITPPISDDEQSTVKTEAIIKATTKPLPPSQYKDINDFFNNEEQHSLPGLERSRLDPNYSKVRELERQRLEREAAFAAVRLRPLGLRRPRRALVTPLSPEWDQKARAAPFHGHTKASKWQNQPHPDSVPLAPKDFSKMVPETAWLNDDAIHATLVCLATFINNRAGVVPKKSTPKCVALSSLYWSSFCQDENKIYPRPFNRKWGMNPDNFFDIDTVLIPVNLGNHWTLLVIRPSRHTISYVDSFHSSGERQLAHALNWLRLFLGKNYRSWEWTDVEFTVPSQTNGYDCGMFVITNSIYLALGLDPNSYTQADMPLQRRRIAAMLLNGGFTGPFDLSQL